MAEKITTTELMEAGVHFGHLTRKWNPKMSEYIFMENNGIHIIDLNKKLDAQDKKMQALETKINN